MSHADQVAAAAIQRAQQLEARVTAQATLLVERAVSDLRDLTNTLAYLVEQTEIGNAGARDVLLKYFEMQDRARAAAHRILLPAGPAKPADPGNNGHAR